MDTRYPYAESMMATKVEETKLCVCINMHKRKQTNKQTNKHAQTKRCVCILSIMAFNLHLKQKINFKKEL